MMAIEPEQGKTPPDARDAGRSAGKNRQAVLIWEPDPLQGEYLCGVYGQAGFSPRLLQGYQALRDAMQAYRHLPVLVVIGHLDKLHRLKSLQSLCPLASLLVLTPRQDLDTALALLEAGADACLAQPVQAEELLARSQSLLRQTQRILRSFGRFQSDKSISRGPLTLYPDRHEVELAGRRQTLSSRQFSLLHCLCLHADTLVTREQLSQVLDSDRARLSPRQLDNLVLALRKRLPEQADFAIETRYGSGYLLKTRL